MPLICCRHEFRIKSFASVILRRILATARRSPITRKRVFCITWMSDLIRILHETSTMLMTMLLKIMTRIFVLRPVYASVLRRCVYVLAYVGLDFEPLLRAVETVCDEETEVLLLINDSKRRLANRDFQRSVGSKVHNHWLIYIQPHMVYLTPFLNHDYSTLWKVDAGLCKNDVLPR